MHIGDTSFGKTKNYIFHIESIFQYLKIPIPRDDPKNQENTLLNNIAFKTALITLFMIVRTSCRFKNHMRHISKTNASFWNSLGSKWGLKWAFHTIIWVYPLKLLSKCDISEFFGKWYIIFFLRKTDFTILWHYSNLKVHKYTFGVKKGVRKCYLQIFHHIPVSQGVKSMFYMMRYIACYRRKAYLVFAWHQTNLEVNKYPLGVKKGGQNAI